MKIKQIMRSMLCIVLLLSGCGSNSSDASDVVQSTAGSTETAASSSSVITIEPQELLNYQGLTVTAESYEQGGIFGDAVKVLIDNQSDQSYGVTLDAVIVNNYMVTSLFSEVVTSGNKDNASIDLYSSQLNSAGIEHIGQIELYFHLYDPDSYETVYTADPVTIQTSDYDIMDTEPNDDGTELYNANGIRIVGKYVDNDNIWGTGIVLYLENQTDQNITVQCDTISVNGFMMTPYFSSTVYAHKMAVDDITIMQSDLDDNGIDQVNDIQMTFNIYNADTFDTIAGSDPIDYEVSQS